jgi:hypothetical protein
MRYPQTLIILVSATLYIIFLVMSNEQLKSRSSPNRNHIKIASAIKAPRSAIVYNPMWLGQEKLVVN